MRTYGIEIEAYNVPAYTVANALSAAGIPCNYEGYNHVTRNHWKVVSDSSLTGVNTFELVSPPLSGDDGFAQIEKVCQVLNDLGAKVNKSCGLHVHIDARNLALNTIKNICKIYYSEEAGIDAWMAPSRRDSRWCQTLRNIRGGFAEFYQTLDRDIDTLRSLQSLFNTRYRKVNLEAFNRHGTVEFRQHQGTTDSGKIINWVRFLHLLVEKAITARPRPRKAQTVLTQAEEVTRVLDYVCDGHDDLKAFFRGRVEALNSRAVTR